MVETVATRIGSPSPTEQVTTKRVSFPKPESEEFQLDPRVSYSKVDEKWILEDDDGSEWAYDETLGKWLESLDTSLLEQQSLAYTYQNVDKDESVHTSKKRKIEVEETSNAKKPNIPGSHHTKKVPTKHQNRAIFVTSLPHDATVKELHDVFERAGVIAEEDESGAPRIKLYNDKDGKPKGEALIVFFRPESINLAIRLLDETDLRYGQRMETGPMRVVEADQSFKKQKINHDKPKGSKSKEEQKSVERSRLLNKKLADWDDEEPSTLPPHPSIQQSVVVLLKHMWTATELEEDELAAGEINEDITEACTEIGPVKELTLLLKEVPEGQVRVRFGDGESARKCVLKMSGRYFAGRAVEAVLE